MYLQLKNKKDTICKSRKHGLLRTNRSAPNMYTQTEVNELLTGTATSSDITSALTRTADNSTTFYQKRIYQKRWK